MKLFFFLLLLITLSSCSEDDNKFKERFKANYLESIKDTGVDYNKDGVPQVKIVSKALEFRDRALLEKWPKSKWIESMGEPAYIRTVDDSLYLEYIQPGPYPHIGEKMITGIIVIIKNDMTYEVNDHYTSFGVPPK
jgi:hypothetical protein